MAGPMNSYITARKEISHLLHLLANAAHAAIIPGSMSNSPRLANSAIAPYFLQA